MQWRGGGKVRELAKVMKRGVGRLGDVPEVARGVGEARDLDW